MDMPGNQNHPQSHEFITSSHLPSLGRYYSQLGWSYGCWRVRLETTWQHGGPLRGKGKVWPLSGAALNRVPCQDLADIIAMAFLLRLRGLGCRPRCQNTSPKPWLTPSTTSLCL